MWNADLSQPSLRKLKVMSSLMFTTVIGMVLMDHNVRNIFSSCWQLFTRRGALATMMGGIALATQWSSLPILVEVDRMEATYMAQTNCPDCSRVADLVNEIKTLMHDDYIVCITHIMCSQNSASHFCGYIWWIGPGPDDIVNICHKNCNDPS